MTSHPKRRKGRRRRRRKRRKNTRRGTGALHLVAGRALTPFIPATSRGSRRKKGPNTHMRIDTYDPHARSGHCVMSMYVRPYHRVFFCTSSEKAAPLASRFSWLDDLRSPTEQPFCVDSKPDPANWTYKSLYRGDIAR